MLIGDNPAVLGLAMDAIRGAGGVVAAAASAAHPRPQPPATPRSPGCIRAASAMGIVATVFTLCAMVVSSHSPGLFASRPAVDAAPKRPDRLYQRDGSCFFLCIGRFESFPSFFAPRPDSHPSLDALSHGKVTPLAPG